jgi:hypothetical protein
VPSLARRTGRPVRRDGCGRPKSAAAGAGIGSVVLFALDHADGGNGDTAQQGAGREGQGAATRPTLLLRPRAPVVPAPGAYGLAARRTGAAEGGKEDLFRMGVHGLLTQRLTDPLGLTSAMTASRRPASRVPQIAAVPQGLGGVVRLGRVVRGGRGVPGRSRPADQLGPPGSRCRR